MKVLFVVQGEGRGHLTQAIALRKLLDRHRHTLVAILVGKSPIRVLPEFFMAQMEGIPIESFESPNFIASKDNKVHIWKSLWYNIVHIDRSIRSGRFIKKRIRKYEADVVINFYDLLTGLTYFFSRPKVPMIAMAHQYYFQHPDFVFPDTDKAAIRGLQFYTWGTCLGAYRKLALSFRPGVPYPAKRIVVVPPLLRDAVLNIQPTQGDYLHGYLLHSFLGDFIKQWHADHPSVALHFFWDNKEVKDQMDVDDSLSFHPLDDTLFVQYMAGARGYATTAGFESVCEAIYMGKPLLMVPTHIEQECNAADAVREGVGVASKEFDLDLLLDFAQGFKPHTQFKQWVEQSEKIIVGEIESVFNCYYYKDKIRRRG